MIVDSHCHIFTERIVGNMKAAPDLVRELKLNVHDALPRLKPQALQESAQASGIDYCVMLPTAPPHKVRTENDRFIAWTREYPRLRTLATLHPMMQGISEEVRRVFDLGINGFKLSSFSQRFDVSSHETGAMLSTVETLGRDRGSRPVLVFDTFLVADKYLGADPTHLTSPAKLADLVERYAGIDFIAAHMGGLLADFDELRTHLIPSANLYLDTSNAAHTLREDHFTELLRIHGPGHVLFGTDWPWFVHAWELPKIQGLLEKAGYDRGEREAVFGENARRLLGL
ncbi:MAG: amidohydrolase family protein [Pseudomonadota bacterium]